MSYVASKHVSRHLWTPAIRQALDDWGAPIIVWLAVTAMLLGVLAFLLGPEQ
jgi:hypothetical protein